MHNRVQTESDKLGTVTKIKPYYIILLVYQAVGHRGRGGGTVKAAYTCRSVIILFAVQWDRHPTYSVEQEIKSLVKRLRFIHLS